jgi:sugar (pentulose or hexulose) kinase
MASMRASGASWDWFVRLASGLHPATHQELIALAQRVPFGSEGARFLAYVRQQSVNPLEPQPTAGAFLGLHENHGLGHLARAVLEGLSFETYRLFEEIVKATGNPLPPIRAVGGSTQNPLWIQSKADFMQTPIETYRSPHAAAWGAAWLAGHHLGLVGPIEPQVQSRFEPTESAQELLESYQQALKAAVGHRV